MTKKKQLYYLLEAFMCGKYDIPTFCEAFESAFYPDVPFNELSKFELEKFKILGDKVARFSPFEEDLRLYPDVYNTEDDIEKAIKNTLDSLKNFS
jgi:hypothetical protein